MSNKKTTWVKYGTKNFSQTATKHSCDKARASANENVINSKEPTSKKRKSIDNYFWSGPQQKRLKRLLAQILFENSSSVSFSLIDSSVLALQLPTQTLLLLLGPESR
ncbi:hypothetical protein WJX79_001419 [Trebouxia sp. C0005]